MTKISLYVKELFVNDPPGETELPVSGGLLEERGRVALAEPGERGKQPQSRRQDVCGFHGTGADQVHQRVALDAADALQQFGIPGLLALVMPGEGADERVGGGLAIQAG